MPAAVEQAVAVPEAAATEAEDMETEAVEAEARSKEETRAGVVDTVGRCLAALAVQWAAAPVRGTSSGTE